VTDIRRAASLLSVLAFVCSSQTAWSGDAPTLEDRAAAIERASQQPDGIRVVVGHLSRKLDISVETLRVQRAQTAFGWGDLLIATRVSRATGMSLDQVAAEFRSGEGWEALARRHHVDLDTLTRDVEQSQESIEQHAEDRTPHAVELGGGRPSSSGRGAGSPGADGGARGRR
jgi:hypothetical protein